MPYEVILKKNKETKTVKDEPENGYFIGDTKLKNAVKLGAYDGTDLVKVVVGTTAERDELIESEFYVGDSEETIAVLAILEGEAFTSITKEIYTVDYEEEVDGVIEKKRARLVDFEKIKDDPGIVRKKINPNIKVHGGKKTDTGKVEL